jgi:cell division septation protein DedD
MPDLNLVDEGGLEESPVPAAPARSSGGGGGGSKGVIIIVVLVLVFGGGGFFLYKKGIFPFKKKPAVVAQVQEEQLPQDQPDQNAAQQAQNSGMDTTAVALVDTPPLDNKAGAKKVGDMKAGDSKMRDGKKGEASEMSVGVSSKLGDMKGDYTVQVVAFHEKVKADEIVKNLEAADYPAFVEKIPMKAGDWYTVRVGRYPTRKEARNAVKTFAEQLQSSYFIDKVRSK